MINIRPIKRPNGGNLSLFNSKFGDDIDLYLLRSAGNDLTDTPFHFLVVKRGHRGIKGFRFYPLFHHDDG